MGNDRNLQLNRFVPVDLDCDGTRTGRRNDLPCCDGNGFVAAGGQ